MSLATHLWIIHVVGAGASTDALNASVILPSLILSVLAGSLSRVLIPLFHESPGDVAGLLRTLSFAAGGVFLVLGLAIASTARAWVLLAFRGFAPATAELTGRMVAIQSLGLPFMALSVVFTAAHHSRHRYVAAEARALVPNLVFLGALLAFLPRSSVEVAAWLMVGRQVLTCLALAPVDLLRTPTPRNGGRVAEVVRRSMPLIAGALVYKSGPFVDRYISSFAPAGSLTLLGLAQQGYAALLHLFDKSGASIFTGQMSELCSTGRTPEALALYRRAAKGIIPIATAVAAAAIAAVWCLGELAAAHCWVPASTARGLALLVAVLGGTLPGGAWGQVAAGGLYAAGRTGVVAAYATLGFLTSVAIKVLSFYMFGLHGLAVGVVAYQFINAATLHAVLIRDLRRSGG